MNAVSSANDTALAKLDAAQHAAAEAASTVDVGAELIVFCAAVRVARRQARLEGRVLPQLAWLWSDLGDLIILRSRYAEDVARLDRFVPGRIVFLSWCSWATERGDT